jgi:ABC-2 type transport system ATP-binding protein
MVAEDVRKTYKDVKALDGVTLAAEEGKILGLLGPNGAGKTTLVRILTTLLKPTGGRVSVAGIDVVKNPDQVRRIIGLAGQYPAVDEQLTGRENLIMVGQLYHFRQREAKVRAAELLKRFALEDAADRPVRTYSGGMRRRLDLGAAIVARPPILLLDEPTTGLDPRTRVTLWSLIQELVDEGATLLLTTQYLDEADKLADRIVLLNQGKVAAEGTPEQLKTRLGNDVIDVRVPLPALAQAAALLQPLSNGKTQTNEETGQIALPVREGTKSLIEVVRLLDSASIEIADIAVRSPSLDDVFLSLTDEVQNAA